MKKSPVDQNGAQRKVVSLQLDAKFYFERAIQSLERHRYDKALKYFQFSIEKEPENPINHCNLAGLLSELGRFVESNRVLETVLSDIDPEFHECWFYMANNYAHMGYFELAENCLLEYMERQPDGEYSEEAEEMLNLLSYELGRPPKEFPEPLPVYMKEHETARRLLEEGRFAQAAKALQKIVESTPDFWAAYNNLSLAYYYMGRIEEAIQLTEQVLEKEPGNLHALCNRALLAHSSGDRETCTALVEQLKKLVPLHHDHLYKLATTFGMLGEHESAYQLFSKMFRTGVNTDASFFHSLAASACNTGRRSEAKRFWERAVVLDPKSHVPRFYLDQLHRWLAQPDAKIPTVLYDYHMPYEEKIFQLQRSKQLQSRHDDSEIDMDDLLRSSFFWVFAQEDQTAKAQAVQLLGMIANRESEQLLRHYLLQETSKDDECKKLALFLLRRMGGQPPYLIWMQNQLVVIEIADDEQTKPYINRIWSQILVCCLEGMKHYSIQSRSDAKALLLAFLKKHRKKLPTVHKIGGWAAALEYVVARHHGFPLTQSEVANKYNVSPSTVAGHVKKLSQLKKVFIKY